MQTHQEQQIFDWLPDWFLQVTLRTAGVVTDQELTQTQTSRASPNNSHSQTLLSHLHENDGEAGQFNIKQAKTLYICPSANRTVKRKLRGIHIFMITVNGTLGTGLYWRGGQILELAGPLAAVLSFLLIGLLSWAVMQFIVIALIVINAGAGEKGYLGVKNWSSSVVFDHDAADSWGIAFLMCLSIATFAYVGVEVVAASALESALDTHRQRLNSTGLEAMQHNGIQIGSTVKLSSMYFSLLATLAYTLSGLLVSLDIPWNHCSLPRLSWISTITECLASPTSIRTETASAFVVIAAESMIPHLHNVFNAFLVFTCITCASTQLYVASRTLFGLTSRLDGGRGQPWYIQFLAFLGRTNSQKVPIRAMAFSAAAFFWVPFLQLRGGITTTTPIGMFIEILAQMGSVPVVVVWACEALAYIRYYHCISRHRSVIERQRIPQVRRFSRSDYDDYPYRGPLQPYLGYLALVGCLFVLIVANGASLWGGFYLFPFLSSFLFILVYIGVWVLLKLVRRGTWTWVDLSNSDKVVRKLRKLHDIRLAAA
ncbi:hypothetical protein BDV11DRAFT_167080 [Aspergillus similis]